MEPPGTGRGFESRRADFNATIEEKFLKNPSSPRKREPEASLRSPENLPHAMDNLRVRRPPVSSDKQLEIVGEDLLGVDQIAGVSSHLFEESGRPLRLGHDRFTRIIDLGHAAGGVPLEAHREEPELHRVEKGLPAFASYVAVRDQSTGTIDRSTPSTLTRMQ